VTIKDIIFRALRALSSSHCSA